MKEQKNSDSPFWEEITVNGVLRNSIRFTDDTAQFAGSEEELQPLLHCVANEISRLGLNINIQKTKVMVISRDNINLNITRANNTIEQVHRLIYLGQIIDELTDLNTEIRLRKEQARTNFMKLQNFICNRHVNVKLRESIIQCFVWSTPLHAWKTWILKQDSLRRLTVFEIWTYRRILRISWTGRITNIEVLNRLGKRPQQ